MLLSKYTDIPTTAKAIRILTQEKWRGNAKWCRNQHDASIALSIFPWMTKPGILVPTAVSPNRAKMLVEPSIRVCQAQDPRPR